MPTIQAHMPRDLRCPCGSLVARLVPGGVELKCRRCRRLFVVPLTGGSDGGPGTGGGAAAGR